MHLLDLDGAEFVHTNSCQWLTTSFTSTCQISKAIHIRCILSTEYTYFMYMKCIQIERMHLLELHGAEFVHTSFCQWLTAAFTSTCQISKAIRIRCILSTEYTYVMSMKCIQIERMHLLELHGAGFVHTSSCCPRVTVWLWACHNFIWFRASSI